MYRALLNLLCVSVLIYGAQCGSLYNVTMEITPEHGKPFNITVVRNIERKTLDMPDIEVKRIKIHDQHVPRIQVGSVQHLIKLTTIDFVNCSTEVVEARAFRNLPKLRAISLIYSYIKTIPVGVFHELPSLMKIRVSNNRINTIEDGAFGNIPTLQLLLLAGNKLKNWNPNWITDSTALEEIDVRYNQITKIPKNAFPGLKNLKRVRFDINDLSVIEPGAFEGLRRLEILSLSYNLLTTIDPHIFPNRLTIDNLLIDANKLNYMSNEVLDKVSVKNITFDGNPWTCPCLDRFAFRLSQNNVTVVPSALCRDGDVPVCAFSNVYSQTCLDIVDDTATRMYFEKVKIAVDHSQNEFYRCFRFD